MTRDGRRKQPSINKFLVANVNLKYIHSYKSAIDERVADDENVRKIIVRLSEIEDEINRLRHFINVLDLEIARLRDENERMSNEINHTRTASSR